jgi:hypothetical protein
MNLVLDPKTVELIEQLRGDEFKRSGVKPEPAAVIRTALEALNAAGSATYKGAN